MPIDISTEAVATAIDCLETECRLSCSDVKDADTDCVASCPFARTLRALAAERDALQEELKTISVQRSEVFDMSRSIR